MRKYSRGREDGQRWAGWLVGTALRDARGTRGAAAMPRLLACLGFSFSEPPTDKFMAVSHTCFYFYGGGDRAEKKRPKHAAAPIKTEDGSESL